MKKILLLVILTISISHYTISANTMADLCYNEQIPPKVQSTSDSQVAYVISLGWVVSEVTIEFVGDGIWELRYFQSDIEGGGNSAYYAGAFIRGNGVIVSSY